MAAYPAGRGPDPARVAGVDLGIIHPYAVAGPDGAGLVVSGRALRAESRLHLADTKARRRAVAARAPAKGQRGSRRWRQYRARSRRLEARHRRRLAQARHEAARTVIDWALDQRVGTLVVGDPVGVLDLHSGARHDQRSSNDSARPAAAPPACWPTKSSTRHGFGITVVIVDERATSSTCPGCARRVAQNHARGQGGVSPARQPAPTVSPTATSSGRPTSPPNTQAADNRSPSPRPSRTVEAASTYPVPADPGVTRAAPGSTPTGHNGSPGRPRPAPTNPREVARPPPRQSRIHQPKPRNRANVDGCGTTFVAPTLRDGPPPLRGPGGTRLRRIRRSTRSPPGPRPTCGARVRAGWGWTGAARRSGR